MRFAASVRKVLLLSAGHVSFLESLYQVSKNLQVQEVAEKSFRANSCNSSKICYYVHDWG